MVYVGAKDLDTREKKAAAEIEGAIKTAIEERRALTPKEESEIKATAAKYGVNVGRIKSQAAAQASEGQSYGYSPGKAVSSTVVKTEKGTYIINKEKNKIYSAKIAGRKIEGTKEYVESKIQEHEAELKKRAEETFRKQQAKAAEEGAIIVSQKFYDLYQKRKPEIEKILKEEAGEKAWKQWVEDTIQKRKEERKGIEEAKDILKMQPSMEKLKKYYTLWATKPEEFETARAELRHEAILKEDKITEWQLSAAKPFSYSRQHPVKTAFIIGAVTVPGLQIASKIPGVRIISSKAAAGLFSLAYGAAKGYEAGKKVREQPLDYARPSSILEIGSEMPIELFAFSAGRKTSQALIRAPALIGTKLKEIRLSRSVRGKSAAEAKRILINELQLEGEPQKQIGTKAISTSVRVGKEKILITPEPRKTPAKISKDLSVKLRVKDLKGFTAIRETTTSKGKLISVGKYSPKYSKPYLIDPSEIIQPDAALINVRAEKIGYILPDTKVKGGLYLITGSAVYESGSSNRFIVSNKAIKDYFLKPAKLTAKLDVGKGTLRERAVSLGIIESVQFDTYSGQPYKSLPDKQPRLEYWFAKLGGPSATSKITYTYKLEGPDVIWKPVISESGEALGSYKINLKTQKIEFITAGRGISKKVAPINIQPAVTESGIESVSDTGQVTIQKYKVAEGVKLKQTFQKQETIFAPLKTETKSESKSKTEAKSEKATIQKKKKFTVFEDLSTGRFDTLKDVLVGTKSKLAIASIPLSKSISSSKNIQDIASKSRLNIVQAEDVMNIQDMAQAKDILPATDTKTDLKQELKKISPRPGRPVPPDIFNPPDTLPPPGLALGLPGKKEQGADQFNIFVRRRGVFELIGSKETARAALSLGKRVVSQTAAASFKVVPVRGSIDIKGLAANILSPSQFRMSKIEPDVFVERKEKRIKTAGEKREITFKGIFARQRKSKKRKGFFSFF